MLSSKTIILCELHNLDQFFFRFLCFFTFSGIFEPKFKEKDEKEKATLFTCQSYNWCYQMNFHSFDWLIQINSRNRQEHTLQKWLAKSFQNPSNASKSKSGKRTDIIKTNNDDETFWSLCDHQPLQIYFETKLTNNKHIRKSTTFNY